MLALATFALKSTLVLLCAALAAVACKRLGAAYRHLILTAGFAVILALPVLQSVVPSRPVWLLPRVTPRTVALPAPRVEEAPVSAEAHQILPAVSKALPPEPAPSVSLRSGVNLLALVWALGALLCLGRQIVSLGILARAAAKATRLDAGEYRRLAEQAGVRRAWILIRDDSKSAGPRTWGLLRPVVSLPQSSLSCPREQREAVVFHELIHIRRLDSLTQSLAALACAVYWNNPLAWIAARLAKKEAESAADDAVLQAGIKPSVYAEALVQAALEYRSSGRFLSAGVPLMKQSRIETRIDSILRPGRRSRSLGPVGLTATAMAALAVAVPCAALSAQASPPPKPELERLGANVGGHAHPHPSPSHAGPGHSEDPSFRKEIEDLQAQLRAEQAQLGEMQRQIRELRSQAHRKPAMLIDHGRKLHAQADRLKPDMALIEVKRAQFRAAQDALAQARAGYKAGLASDDSLAKAEADLQAQRAQLATAMLEMHRSQGGQDLAAADARVAALREQIRLAQGVYDRDLKLRDQGVLSQDQLAQAKARLLELKAQLAAVEHR